jgi:meiotically up-regulated gene 157 (Mug157) protein
LATLERTDAGTFLMHEGFHADDPAQFTRPWFAWANAMFCEFVLAYCGKRTS